MVTLNLPLIFSKLEFLFLELFVYLQVKPAKTMNMMK